MRYLLITVFVLTGCAGARTKRCLIPNVGIAILPEEEIDRVCFALTGSMVADNGEAYGPRDRSLGCALKSPPTIIVPGPGNVLDHEMGHLMAWYCGDKAP